MKKFIYSSTLIFIALLCTSSADAWQLYNGFDQNKLEPGIVILEPDNWGKKELTSMKERHITPIAWLNLTQIEEGRLIDIDIREKDYMLAGKYMPRGQKLSIFYSQAFRSLIKSRLREYLLKGFSGVVFAKAGLYNHISNSPINRSEMLKLIKDMAKEARKLNSRAIILVHDSQEFWTDFISMPYIAGVVEEGLYFGQKGREVKSWHRESTLERLKVLQQSNKLILVAEDARNKRRKDFVLKMASSLVFDAGFTELPIDIKRSKANGKAK